MLNSLRISALAAVLTAATAGLTAANAQAAIPDLRGTQFDRPDVYVYSWGIETGNPTEQQTRYTWDQVNQELAAAKVRPVAASSGLNAGQRYDLRGTKFDRPDVTVYSWGIETGNATEQQTRYTWDQVNQELARQR